ncbi:MAG: Na(+)-translocating NADH-quinone reductase subunit A [Alistipes sp.]|nr:Na(+)-translocating NADH-quinone reductase subunit A [Alistipes sp.]
MSKTIKLKRGLDIKLQGEAERNISQAPQAETYAVSPTDFEGVVPKLLVREGDAVKAGSPLFFDKNNPEVLFPSPVSGKVSAVVRGDKRKLLAIVVQADQKQQYEQFDVKSLDKCSREDVTALLLRSGLWPFVIQRPYGIIADPEDMPKSIFISGFDSAPLAPDMNFALKDQTDNLRKGIDALKKLTTGKVHIGIRAKDDGVISMLTNAEQHFFSGPHPAGNVGVQIHHVDPVNKGEVVWTVDIQNVAIIGRLFNHGIVDMTRVYAVTGSEIVRPAYVRAIAGAPVMSLLKDNIKPQADGDRVRIINGNVLTGKKTAEEGYVAYSANQVTVIPEGDKYEFVGWAMPRFDKFSVSRAYFSWLFPNRRYRLDTNMHGGHRPYILTGLFEKYLPMDIYPLYLLKAILAGDIDKMENLGIYEVVEEDLALCEFADPSKNEIQKTVRDGINLMIKELN